MLRAATGGDLGALRDLERLANEAALGHVYPPERYPFPENDVLSRWVLVMDDPSVRILVCDDPDDPDGHGLIALAAYDDSTLRHLAVHPDHWGEGLATEAINAALEGMAPHGEAPHERNGRGQAVASLWCLRENHRARRLYEYLGWRETTDEQEAAWPPYPIEMRYTRLIVQPEG